MKKRIINTFNLPVLSAILILATGHPHAIAQELVIPQRWNHCTYDVPALYGRDTVTLCFIGDVMMHASQIAHALKDDGSYGFGNCFSLIRNDLTEADLAIANMEFPLGGEPHTGYPAFSAPDEIALQMAEEGIDIFLAANNHIFDKGRTGAERTLAVYRSLYQTYGIRFTGAASDNNEKAGNHPLTMIINGIRISFINATYGTNGGHRTGWPSVNYLSDKESLKEAFRTAGNSDVIIALPHWGEEYVLRHSEDQEGMALWMAGMGADAIIGTHPHVIQDTTMINGTHVAYSLGNAISNMSATNTQMELMLELNVIREEDGDITLETPELTFLWCSRPGGFCNDYIVIPVKEYIGKRDKWHDPSDYDKMTATLKRVMKATGIEKNTCNE